MKTRLLAIGIVCCFSLLVGGCAVSPEVAERRAAIDTSIAEILSLPIDSETAPEPLRCLSDKDFRSFEPLSSQYIVFSGRQDKLWVNKLRGRCLDLDRGDVLVTRSFSSMRMCELDTFEVADWFSWPWYRRMPWHWGQSLGSGAACVLGKFHPVTEAQVEEIKAVLKDR